MLARIGIQCNSRAGVMWPRASAVRWCFWLAARLASDTPANGAFIIIMAQSPADRRTRESVRTFLSTWLIGLHAMHGYRNSPIFYVFIERKTRVKLSPIILTQHEGHPRLSYLCSCLCSRRGIFAHRRGQPTAFDAEPRYDVAELCCKQRKRQRTENEALWHVGVTSVSGWRKTADSDEARVVRQ